MSEVVHNHINKVYTADNKGGLQDITRVICVLLPNSLTLCGFDDKANVLLINQFETEHAWDMDFYKSKFVNRSLESLFRKTLSVFADTNKEMLVPKALYSESESERWLKKTYFIETDEIIQSAQLKDKAWYMYTLSADVKTLLEDYLPKAKVLPLGAYQFHKQAKAMNIAECCITENKAFITLYKDKALHWHKVISYEVAEDIVYEVKQICTQQGINEGELVFECTVVNKDLSGIVAKLSQYFPQLEDGSNRNIVKDGEWAGTAYLLQQLNACVS